MLNMQFDRPVVVKTADMEWEASPMAGVWRKPLAREAAEHGHTTSLVRYDAGSRFSAHLHPKGEEIFVLEGVFSDEHGDYPAGTYIRNPPGSRHSPCSDPGCVLLVKLDQFDAADDATLRINSQQHDWQAEQDGRQTLRLHAHGTERVRLCRWPAGQPGDSQQAPGGTEMFVISGELVDGKAQYPAGTWLRIPSQSEPSLQAAQDALIWIKTGHLLP